MSGKLKSRVKSTILAVLVIGFLYLIYFLEKEYKREVAGSSSLPLSSSYPTTIKVESDFYDKIRAKEFIRILIIGDSIGEGTGAAKSEDKWFSRLVTSLDTQYEVTSFITNISIGGASVLGGWTDYNIQKPFLKESYDVIFICFGQNDQGVLPINSYTKIYESLIKQLKEEDKSNPELFLIIENAVGIEEYPSTVRKLSTQYGLNVIDSRAQFKQSGLSSAQLTIDGVHPNSKGHELYHKTILETIAANLLNNKKISPKTGTVPLFVDVVQAKSFNFVATYSVPTDFSSNISNSVGIEKGNSLEAIVTGATLGVTIQQSPEGGMFDVYVDGKFIKQLDNYSPSSRRNTYLIGNSFVDEVHKVRVEINGNKSKSSTGTMVEIIGFVSSGIR